MPLKKTTNIRTWAARPYPGRSRWRAFYCAWALAAFGAWLAAAPSATATHSPAGGRVSFQPIGTTGTAQCFENLTCYGNGGDTFALYITFEVDSEGVRAWNVDLAWDTVSYPKTLNLVSYSPVTPRLFQNPSPPPIGIQYNLGSSSTVQPSAAGQAGMIYGFSEGEADDPSLTVSNVSFRAATVTFQIWNAQRRGNVDLGFFNTATAWMEDAAGQDVTPHFARLWVNPHMVPEPSTGLLAFLGLAGLAMRRRIKRSR